MAADPTEMVHAIADGSATTSCCGRTPFELPAATHRLTQDAGQVTCPGRHLHVRQAGRCVAPSCPDADNRRHAGLGLPCDVCPSQCQIDGPLGTAPNPTPGGVE